MRERQGFSVQIHFEPFAMALGQFRFELLGIGKSILTTYGIRLGRIFWCGSTVRYARFTRLTFFHAAIARFPILLKSEEHRGAKLQIICPLSVFHARN